VRVRSTTHFGGRIDWGPVPRFSGFEDQRCIAVLQKQPPSPTVAPYRIRHTAATMITTVSTSRCKCGLRVNVVSELKRDNAGERLMVPCPNCGDKQAIYAERILYVVNVEELVFDAGRM